MVEVKDSLSRYSHDLTRKQYIRNTKYFIQYCREQYNCRTLDECRQHIDDYIKYLAKKELSACSIHTYAAAISATLNIPLNLISKPRRVISEFTRGREEIKYPHSSQDVENPAYKRICCFAEKCGIRRAEYARLKKEDWVIDPATGKHCVLVRRGKHGKQQYQLVRDEDIPFFEEFFSSVPDGEYLFSKQEMNNRINLHKYRADNAKRWYLELEDKIRQDPSYEDVLIEQIKARFENSIDPHTGKPKTFDPESVRGQYYYLRNSLRQKQIDAGKKIKFNKTIALFISTHVLAHYRLNVCIQNYLLCD
ncbi:MAG: hypothetical protein U0L11_07215 [Acutalibacteraceae bacterium]|nr:hypothetical protein [Acutalibacteraceae bacterium]